MQLLALRITRTRKDCQPWLLQFGLPSSEGFELRGPECDQPLAECISTLRTERKLTFLLIH